MVATDGELYCAYDFNRCDRKLISRCQCLEPALTRPTVRVLISRVQLFDVEYCVVIIQLRKSFVLHDRKFETVGGWYHSGTICSSILAVRRERADLPE